MEDGIEDQSRYGKFSRNPKSNPRYNDQVEVTKKWLMQVGFFTLLYCQFWYFPVNGIEHDLDILQIMGCVFGLYAASNLLAVVLTRLRFRLIRPIMLRIFFRQ